MTPNRKRCLRCRRKLYCRIGTVCANCFLVILGTGNAHPDVEEKPFKRAKLPELIRRQAQGKPLFP